MQKLAVPLLGSEDGVAFFWNHLLDYLSVDTEGSELDILSAFDCKRYAVRVITVEHNYREDTRSALHTLLSAHGYIRELEQLSRYDNWYYHPGRA